MRLGIVKPKNFVFRLSLLSPFTIFAKTITYHREAMSKIYPVGIQSFEKIREGGYCYIDKTSLIYSLVKSGQYYFLSRPRRFGKSLLISTLEAYFLGRKELFKGLAMEGLEKDWTVHPVLHLDLNTQRYDTPEALTNVLEENLSYWESLYGASESEIGVARRFNGIIRRAAEKTGRKVVVLVDEYDKPMLQAIGNEPLLTDYRNTLKAFYGALKSNDNYLRFALLTGVTKFSKVSVFSDLNNLMDISIDDRFASIRFQRRYPDAGPEKPDDRRRSQTATERTIRRIPFRGRQRRHLQPVQSAQHICQDEVRQLLVRNRHAYFSRGTASAQQV